MRNVFRSTSARLLGAAAGSALVAAVLIVANPFPGSVHGQTVPGGTVSNTTTTAPGTAVSPSVGAAGSAAAPSTGTAPVVTSQAGAAVVTQQPTALPRTGTGVTADNGFGETAGYGLLALAAGLGTAAVVLRTRRAT
jgi:hypothetical protein